ncbi:MAG: DUF3501 family protein [Gemmataceae bacterium]|nr:DUF3501 family protein [Gemmataceae bacterium]
MRLISLDDLLPLEEFNLQRKELFEQQQKYLERFRRVKLGTEFTLIFENRQTLIFRLQEILRVARLTDPGKIHRELAVFNRLIPAQNILQASLLVEQGLVKTLGPLQGNYLRFEIGKHSLPGDLVTARPEDMAVGTSFWVQFAFTAEQGKALGGEEAKAEVILRWGSNPLASQSLSLEMRQALALDLE